MEIADNARKRRKKYGIWLVVIFLIFMVLNLASPLFNDGYIIIQFLWVGGAIYLFGMIGMLIADQAERKGKSWSTFFWLTMLVSPLITGLIIATISPEGGKIVSGTKPCPKCAEPVKLQAILCKHCGSNI